MQFPFATSRKSFHRDPLGRGMRYLRNFSDTDKHRIIVPAFIGIFEATFGPKAVDSQIVAARLLVKQSQTLQVGTKLMRFWYAGGPPSRMIGVEGQLAATPSLPGRPPVMVAEFLGGLHTKTREIVDGLATFL